MEAEHELVGLGRTAGAWPSRWGVDEHPRIRPVRTARSRRSTHGRRYADRAAARGQVKPPPADVSDESLLARLRGGEVSAGEVLVQRYHAPLLRYLQRTAGAGAAEDLHQQTWLSILGHLDRFVPSTDGGSFRGWLFRIATNKTKDHWRSLSREKSAKEGVSRMLGSEAPWAGHAADSTEQQEKLRRAIAQLPDGQRDVLLLRYYSDLKFVDIAEVLGCPLNTALTRAHKALIKLRQAMGRDGAPALPAAAPPDAR